MQRLGEWKAVNLDASRDWSFQSPDYYRAKPREVVTTVNGQEFRWPETVKEGKPSGNRFFILGQVVDHDPCSAGWGDLWHHTREGAETQLAAIQAAAKGVTK